MGQKTIREISVAWKEYKQPYVKQSTMAAYVLILEIIFFQILEKAIHSMNRLCKNLFCRK